MRKNILACVMAGLFAVSALYSPKAEAVVGLILKNKTVTIISAISGGLSGTGAIIAATASSVTVWPILGALGFAAFGAVGIVLLDEETVADVSFQPINLENEKAYAGFTVDQVKTYNLEVEELNAIRKSLIAEISEETSVEAAKALWDEYKTYLSPATIAIAEAKALQFANDLE
jgi:hypothetical protein